MAVSRESADRPALPADPSERGPGNRRGVAKSLVASGLVSAAVVFAYFALPLSAELDADTTLVIIGGLLGVAALLAWHIRSIVRSTHPKARAVAALVTTMPVFLVLFAASYFEMSRAEPSHFSEPMSRLDAAYYTVTVFSTVGFGDITPLSAPARGATTVQMVGDIILVGIVAQVIVGAVRRAVRRQEDEAAMSGADVPKDAG